MSDKTVAEILAECQAICDAATPGPWIARGELTDSEGMLSLTMNHGRGYQDFRFIAHARTAEPCLIEAVKVLYSGYRVLLGRLAVHEDFHIIEAEDECEEDLLKILQPEPTDKQERKSDER